MLACYVDRPSVQPGERFAVHASGDGRPCRLRISRVGLAEEVVLDRSGPAPPPAALPAEADRNGCGWPILTEIEAQPHWRPGYYDIALMAEDGAVARHFVCLRSRPEQRAGAALLVLNTNTYNAYNYFGGRSAYCDVGALMERRLPLAEAMEGAMGVLSTQRPFPPMLLTPPADVPRLLTPRKRGLDERPRGLDPEWARAHRTSPYDFSAGFIHKWEHAFVAWCEAKGIALDYATDYDLDVDPHSVDGFRCVVLAGHSEYWSGPQRDRLEAFVDDGGGLAIFSGNTAFWKVRHEDDGRTMICHKWRGFEADPRAAEDPAAATHLWSHRRFGRPEAEITGLSFIFGGYHRLGNCVSRGAGGYTVYDERHWALAGADLGYGDVIGAEVPLLGYENDGCRFAFGSDGRLMPRPGLGVPASLEIIAVAPTAFGEDPASPYRPLIPPERTDVVLRDALDEHDADAERRLLRGHAVMASFRRGRGEVFNGGTTEWAHALAAHDPFIERITENVLRRFGAL